MKNPLLNAAIMRTLSRLDPVPVRKDTLAAEIDIALAEPVTTLAFDAALADLRQGGFVAVRRDRLLGCDTAGLTPRGRKEAARL